MKKRTMAFAGAALLIVLVAVPFALAQHLRRHRDGGGNGGMMMFGRLAGAQQVLGLSDQQVADIKTIATDLRTQNAPYRTAVRGGMMSAAHVLLANPTDVTAAQAELDQQMDAERQLKRNTLQAVSKALNVLTPEQRTKVATLLQRRATRRSSL